MSIRSRILLGFLLILGPALWVLLDQLADRVERQYLEAAEEPLVDTANLLASLVSHQLQQTNTFDSETLTATLTASQNRILDANIYNYLKTTVNLGLYITDEKGIVLFDSHTPSSVGQDFSQQRDVALTLNGRYGARSTRTNEENERSSVMFIGAPLLNNKNEIIGCLSVSKPQVSLFGFIAQTKQRFQFLGFLITSGSLLSALLIAWWISRPIERLTQHARAIRAGKRPAPPKLGSSEVGSLGRAIEEMRTAIEGRKYAENYVQTLTHEMKSPVAAIRGATELIQDNPHMPTEQRAKFLNNIRFESNRLQHLIERLLALSEVEAKNHLDSAEEVNLAVLLTDVASDYRGALEAAGTMLELQLATVPTILGDPFLLETATSNLLQNAIDFSPRGGKITLGLNADDTGDNVLITVTDEGQGLPEFAVSRAFDRFYSHRPHTGEGRKSSGLGLCFVKETAALHHGAARLENQLGTQGAKATLSLPVRH